MAAHVFLSYARLDKELVEKLYEQLSAAGFSPWMDIHNILPGEQWEASIRRAIRNAHFILVCLSANSVNRRGVIQKEIGYALEIQQEMLQSDIYLIPVLLERCDLPDHLAGYQAVNWFEADGREKLLTALREGLDRRRELGAPKPAPPLSNPFYSAGRVTDPADFFGRDDLMRQLFEELGKGGNRSIVGAAQIGKSSILTMVCALGPRHLQLPPEAFVYINMASLYDEQDFFEKLCEELQIEVCRGYKLERALRGKRYILCLDEIEKMENRRFTPDAREELRGFADGADTPLKLVVASRTPLDQLFRQSPETTSPLAYICPQLTVPPFTDKIARDFIRQRLNGTGISFSQAEIEYLVGSSGGHPARLRRAAAEMFDRYRYQALSDEIFISPS